MHHAIQLLDSIQGRSLSSEERKKQTFNLAAHLVRAARHETTSQEKKRERWMGRMMNDPNGRLFMTALTDQCFRSTSNARTADQLVALIQKYGIPQFLNEGSRMQILLFQIFGKMWPHFFIPLIKKQIRKEMAYVLLPEDPEKRANYFASCRKQNIRVNLNHLGEAILGEEEAKRRLEIYLDDLAGPDVDYISVKTSTLFSQVNVIGWETTLNILAERLRTLYRAAQKKSRFVNLDMEEYKDFDLTVALFKKVLSEPEFQDYQAGIALQSYLPNAFCVLKELTEWANQRKTPIRVRLVKGANLALEKVESSVRGWQQAPFSQKTESDANFKRMLEWATRKEHAQAVHIGIGSHNLFDIAYALILRAEREVEKEVSFEMLEGMATPMRRVVQKLSGSMLLYCPEAKEKDFQNAIAYLIRRLDENCGPKNFLRHFFALQPGNPTWEKQAQEFEASLERMETLPMEPRRRQNRLHTPPPLDPTAPFVNEPDTDFSLKENREWAEAIFTTYKEKKHPEIPLVIGGKEKKGALAKGVDPSRPGQKIYSYHLASETDIEHLFTKNSLPFEEMNAILAKAAHLFRERRGNLIGTMIADGGKTIWEADPEVSEAIDFIEYYRKNWERFLCFSDLKWEAKGTVLVAPPWNFPCSIPVGGIAAALTAGNTVIFKPAPEAVLVGWELVQCFWDAGVPKEMLHFFNCLDDPVGSRLIAHPKLNSVLLTGATETARLFMNRHPALDLHAETGGKNALIVTAMSDRDLALRDLIQSAFGHSGQKCSACSLAILEAEVYDDPRFQRQLKEGAESLSIGSAWNREAKITPLIRPPEGALLKGLTSLEEGESWLLEPKPHPDNPHLWSPGIKYGVSQGSFMHQTELFGPVLGVMRAASLEEAIALANGTPYGLTSGIHTLDEREQKKWKEQIVAGNLYINRGITGAVVRRQPFGGCKASGFGPGAKAGGPNYVAQLARPQQIALPHDRASLPASLAPLVSSLRLFNLNESQINTWKKSAENYAYWADILKEPTDPSCLLGQDNDFYHTPLKRVYLRVKKGDPILPLLQVAAACLVCCTPLDISTEALLPKIFGFNFLKETEATFFERVERGARIRILSSPSEDFLKQAAQKEAFVTSAPVLANGRLELLHYLREVALSFDYHRYGYIAFSKK
ncbi:MAG: 1-pyrroline-5-carboxylate dehydrogenase [Chlamydiales bacterium]|nr:1-pyrroline-5-carboxylate dehydrogenase [Chlamydiales bacterium]